MPCHVWNCMEAFYYQRASASSETYWTDSMITLAWIKDYPNHWKTFVANRVSQIQVNSRGKNSKHFGKNSADLLSRGMQPCICFDKSLWWDDRDEWPSHTTSTREVAKPICKRDDATRDLEFVAFYIFLNYTHLTRVILPKILSSNSCTTFWSTTLQIRRIIRVTLSIDPKSQPHTFKQEIISSGRSLAQSSTLLTVSKSLPRQSETPQNGPEGLSKRMCRIISDILLY